MLCQSNDPKNYKYLVSRFEKEAELLHDLRHPHLPVVKDYFAEGGRYYLVMDFIEGKDLEAVMEAYFPIGVSETEVIEWAIQILDALNYLHSQSPPIIYRDLKPGNIMVQDKDKKAILVDFGIARTINPASQTTMTTVGTPAFAPQELFQGKAEPRTDIYSMGATMHALLSGETPLVPFSFKPISETNPQISKDLEEIVMKSLEDNPDDRYQTALKMKEDLEKLPERDTSPRVLPHPQKTEPISDSLAKTMPPKSSTSDPTILPSAYNTASPKEEKTDKMEEAKEVKDEKKSGNKLLIPALAAGFIIICIIGLVLGRGIFAGPPDTSVILEQADKLFDAGKYSEAKEEYKKVLISKPDNINAKIGIANSYKEMAKSSGVTELYSNAIDGYMKIISNSPNNIDANKGLLDIYINTKKYDKAKEKLEFLSDKNEDVSLEYIELGGIFLINKDYNNSKDCFQKALELDKKNIDALIGLRQTYIGTGYTKENYKDAMKVNKDIYNLNQKDIGSIVELGNINAKIDGNYKSAIKWYEKISPDKIDKNIIAEMTECYLNTGKSDMDENNISKAEESFSKAIKLNKGNEKDVNNKISDIYLDKAKGYLEEENSEQAFKHFKKAIGFNDNQKEEIANICLQKGTDLYKDLSKPLTDAQQYFNFTIEIKPDAEEKVNKILTSTGQSGGNSSVSGNGTYIPPSNPPTSPPPPPASGGIIEDMGQVNDDI